MGYRKVLYESEMLDDEGDLNSIQVKADNLPFPISIIFSAALAEDFVNGDLLDTWPESEVGSASVVFSVWESKQLRKALKAAERAVRGE